MTPLSSTTFLFPRSPLSETLYRDTVIDESQWAWASDLTVPDSTTLIVHGELVVE